MYSINQVTCFSNASSELEKMPRLAAAVSGLAVMVAVRDMQVMGPS
jgi:hypothetical protein